MKKIFFVLCMFLSVNMFAKLPVADFENETGGINVAKADTCWQGADEPSLGLHLWESATYMFASFTVDYGGYYGYTGFTVTNETANTSTGWSQAYRSASGGAFEGSNFAVWNDPFTTDTMIAFLPQVVPGFYINNTAYAVNSMLNGDSFAKKFGKDDFFVLHCIGWLNGEVVDTVDFYLAKDGAYVNQWTYFDLTSLGNIEAVKFAMESSDNSYGYMNTPAYFAMDNFGAAKPEGYVAPAMAEFPVEQDIENTNADVKAVKMIRNGQVVIIRGEKAFNVLGAEL